MPKPLRVSLSALLAMLVSAGCAAMIAVAGLCPALLTGASVGTAGAYVAAAASAGNWGKAEEVPGTPALNKGGSAEIVSVSCASADNCGAGGFYTDRSRHTQAFVAGEVSGVWGRAEEVPGTAALNKGGDAQIASLSCGSPGNCSAGGFYEDGSFDLQAFVVSEVGGVWGKAEEVPGTAALNKGESAGITSVSCGSAGNCSAGGTYLTGSGRGQVFVVSEVGGVWGEAEEVPGTAGLNKGGIDYLSSVSCASAGNCSVGGSYTDGSSAGQAFVVSEVGGVWGKAEEVPGTAALNKGESAGITSVSCASAGNCSAGGLYADSSRHYQALAVGEVSGSWGKAEEVPGTAALNAGGKALVTSVSCTSAGDCSAAGTYKDGSRHVQVFVVSEVSGVWGRAEEVPGIAALNKAGLAGITSVSCASAGNCTVGGSYRVSAAATGNYQAFVAGEVSGVWGTAKEVPGTAALNKGEGAAIASVSCVPGGNCSAGGYYTDGSGNLQAFVVSKS